jgi:hypothetical protein
VTTANAVQQLTILVPTRNEAKNVESLLRRLAANVGPGTVVLFVDGSDDETPQVSQAAPTRGFGSLDTTLLGTLREGFRYLRLLAEIRLSLPHKLPFRPPRMPARLEPIWLLEDLPVRLLTTRNEKFLADSGVVR